ncbi:MAG: GTPase Era [Erysipelotrichaceae bacterium]|nr:GTPase Era [Erysipelotrichaceae bacterium]
MKSGFVTILGKTNAGKSTLINQIVKSKVSIVTHKQQTTRNAIQGIYNDEDSQIVFIDTPGILNPHQKLDKFMNKQAYGSLDGIDAVILLVDGGNPFNEEKDLPLLKTLTNLECPFFVVFNKIDLTNVFLINNLKKKYQEVFPNAEIIEISAIKNVNIDLLIRKIKDVLPDGYQFYPEDVKSDHPISFLISEIIREKMLLCLDQEVPHCTAVKIEKMEKINDTLQIDATIVCEKPSQKGIIIGSQGKMLKKIGTKARLDIEKILSRKVNLKTFVRVEEKWRDSTSYLKEFGYFEE